MDIRIVGDNTSESKAEEANIPNKTTIPDSTLLVEQVAQTFDMKPSEVSQYKGKLESLIEYAKYKTDDHSPEGIKWAIRQLGVKVGTPPLGEKLINYLNLYARLYLEGKHIEEQKEKFLRGEQD